MHYHAQVHQYLIFFFKKSSLGLTLQKEKKGFYAKGGKASLVMWLVLLICVLAQCRPGEVIWMTRSLSKSLPFPISQTKLAAISRKAEHKTLQQQGMFPSVCLITGCSHKRAVEEFQCLGGALQTSVVIPWAS